MMMSTPQIVLFVNDSYFASRLAEPIISRLHASIALVALSTRTKSSPQRLSGLLRRASWRYLGYRGVVEIAGRAPWNKRSVQSLAKRFDIPNVTCADTKAVLHAISAIGARPLLGIAINFDQILPPEILDQFPRGVVNCHASRLPKDRGISPALWAFARGDPTIWVTLYQIDAGLDTGPIFEQFEVALLPNDSAFSAYRRVCEMGGERLAQLTLRVLQGEVQPYPQQGLRESPLSWPDRKFSDSLAASGRRLLKIRDLVHLIRAV